MKRKFLSLCVILMLLVTSLSFAAADGTETVTTISVQPGSLLSEITELNQISDIAAIRLHSLSDGYGAFVLSLNETDVLQAMVKAEEDGIFVQSAILGQQPLYFSWADVQKFITEQMETMAQLETPDMPFDMDMMLGMMDGTMTEEQIMETLGVDDTMLAYITEIAENTDVQNGTFSISGSDIANQKTVLQITSEDIIKAIDLTIVQENLTEQTKASYPEYSEAEIKAEVDAQTAEIKQIVQSSNIIITSTAYTVDDDFVAYKFAMDAIAEDSPIAMTAIVTKTSIDTAAFYQLTVTLTEDDMEFVNQKGSLYVSDTFITGEYTIFADPDEAVLTASLNVDLSQPDVTNGEITATFNDGSEQSAVIVFDNQKAGNVTDTEIQLFVGGSVSDIKSALNESDLITLRIHKVVQEDSGFFAALQAATPETSVQMLQMNDEELNGYMENLEQGLMITMLTVIDNLPPDISESLMQGFNGF